MELTIIEGIGMGEKFPLNKPVVRIGRGADNDVILQDPQVSRHHAELRREGGRWYIIDLNSTNGTFVNGQRIGPGIKYPVELGSTIRMGQTTFSLEEAAGIPPTEGIEEVAPTPGIRPWVWAGAATMLVLLLLSVGLFYFFVLRGKEKATPTPTSIVIIAPSVTPTAQPFQTPSAPETMGSPTVTLAPIPSPQITPSPWVQPPPGTPPAGIPPTALPTGAILPEQIPTLIATYAPGVPPELWMPIVATVCPGCIAPNPTLVGQVGGKIAFAALDATGQKYNIYLINADGSGLRVFLEEASEPAFSPDGKRLAYYSWKSDKVGLRIINVDGSGDMTLTSNKTDSYPSWAPDGNRLVFYDEADKTIHIINADGSGRKGIIRGEFPVWSPRGDKIAYKGCIGGDCGIIIANPDGSNPVRITTDPSDGQPAWSPDGTKIAFTSHRDGNWEIYTVNADGSFLWRVTYNPATDGLPCWSPDGTIIAFRSDRGGRWAIYITSAAGGGAIKLVDANTAANWTWEKMSWTW